jgi:hypothetical protein
MPKKSWKSEAEDWLAMRFSTKVDLTIGLTNEARIPRRY